MSDESQYSAAPNKKPRGILKNSSSFDQTGAMGGAGNRKSAKFDELNVLQTYHPPGKDYGHMKVEEPKTPYNYADNSDVEALDADLLAEKLKVAAEASSSSSDEDEFETEEQKSKRHEFEKRRKAHYNEYQAVQLARKLMEEEEEEVDDGSNTKSKLPKMDVEPSTNTADGGPPDDAV